MKAVGYQQSLPATDDKALQDIELPQPVASGRDILVRVEAVSVNPVDTKVRLRVEPEAGQYKVLGWDAAGEVVAVGEDVSLFKAGDKVFYAGSLTRPGSNSEYQLVDERIVALMPECLSYAEAPPIKSALTLNSCWYSASAHLLSAREYTCTTSISCSCLALLIRLSISAVGVAA